MDLFFGENKKKVARFCLTLGKHFCVAKQSNHFFLRNQRLLHCIFFAELHFE